MGSISRSRFLTGSAATLIAAAAGDGFLVEPTAIEVTHHDVPGLAPAFDGLRIACVADVHLHNGVHAAARKVLDHLAREQPEIVVLTGDMCNHRRDLPDLVAWAREARGTLAAFATLGNWEHYAGIDRRTAEDAYSRAGVQLLFNTAAVVSTRGAALTVVGLDDPVAGAPDLAAALADVGPDATAVWLLHGPGYVDGIPCDTQPAPALILAGHTHGGQIRLPFFTPYVPPGSGRFVAGWYRDAMAPLYVSRGIGTIVVRARLFCPPELPIFTLRTAEPAGVPLG